MLEGRKCSSAGHKQTITMLQESTRPFAYHVKRTFFYHSLARQRQARDLESQESTRTGHLSATRHGLRSRHSLITRALVASAIVSMSLRRFAADQGQLEKRGRMFGFQRSRPVDKPSCVGLRKSRMPAEAVTVADDTARHMQNGQCLFLTAMMTFGDI